MTAITISLPESLHAYLQAQANEKAKGDVSAYIQELILAEQIARERQEIDKKLLAGIKSIEEHGAHEMTDADWKELAGRASSKNRRKRLSS
jgi:Arc/MetJ-type ribon-helix-helix transcriptional regulator